MKNIRKNLFRFSLLTFLASGTAAWAAGSKAPGPGSFQDLNTVQSNGNYILVSDSRKSDLKPLSLPTRVAFTRVDNSNAVMILRNDKRVNFRFNLPNYFQLGSMKQPVSLNPNNRLSQKGDRVVVAPGAAGTGQDLGIRLVLQDQASNSYSVDGHESCSVPRTRQVSRQYCWRDSQGRRVCETQWYTETYYEYGRRYITTHYSSESAVFGLTLFDASGNNQMQSSVRYSRSNSYVTYRGACRLY